MDLKERLKDLGTTIPGTIGLLFIAIAAAYDAIRQGYEYLLSLGIRFEITEIGLLKLAIAVVCIGLILSRGHRTSPLDRLADEKETQ